MYVKTKVENKKRVDLTWQELKENLCKVISVCYSSTPEKLAKPHLKVSDERDEAVVAHKEQLMKKIKTHRLKLHTDKQKEKMLPKFIENPEIFIRMQIQHLRKEEEDEDASWCKGTVLSVRKQHKNSKLTLFDIVYDNLPDSTRSCKLISEFEKGQVIVLPSYFFTSVLKNLNQDELQHPPIASNDIRSPFSKWILIVSLSTITKDLIGELV